MASEIEFSKFDLLLEQASREFEAVVEADIRSAHEERVTRPRLSGIPDYLYRALLSYQDEDRKEYEAELTAQCRAMEDPGII